MPSMDEPDRTMRRLKVAESNRSLHHDERLLDTTVVLEGCGHHWQVHALVLAGASPVLGYILEDVKQICEHGFGFWACIWGCCCHTCL